MSVTKKKAVIKDTSLYNDKIGASKQLSKFRQEIQRKADSVNWNMEHFSIMVSFNQHQSNHISQSEQREISQRANQSPE